MPYKILTIFDCSRGEKRSSSQHCIDRTSP